MPLGTVGAEYKVALMWFLRVEGLLDAERLARLDRLIADADFVDGRATAGRNAAAVKHNEQLARDSDQDKAQAIDEILVGALQRNDAVQTHALPLRILPPLIARYAPGKRYGMHSDNPLMSGLRTDVSCTIFLSDPESYDGGALEVHSSSGRVVWKLPRGDAVLYPSGALHQVQEVSRGERLAAVTWLQSRVPEAHRRGVLADLDQIARIASQRDPQCAEALLATKTYGDLLRMWAET